MKYQYHTSLTSLKDFPFLLRKAQFILDGEERKRIREGVSNKGLWGDVQTFVVLNDDTFPFPSGLEIEWISVMEQKYFCINAPLDAKYMEKLWLQYAQEEEEVDDEDDDDDDEEDKNDENDAVAEDDEDEEEEEKTIKSIFNYVAVGIAPHGGVAVWLHGGKKQSLIVWLHAEEKELTLDEQRSLLWGLDIKTYCDAAVKQIGLESVVIPEPKLFDNMMLQYSYKWQPVLKKWDENEDSWKDYQEEEILPELDFVEVKCFDGSYDKLRDGSLMECHSAGKPSHLTVNWHVAKRRYGAYFFFDHDELQAVFSRCYGVHPDTKVDILVQMDPEINHYELALYRYGMKEPLKIDESAYQLMVFRNKFECFRSENYNLPPGSWRW